MKIERKRGDTRPIRRQIKSKATGNAIDVTGWSFVLTVNTDRYPEDDTNEVFQITGTLQAPTDGIVYFSPSTEQAAEVGDFYFDIQATDDTGKVETIEHDIYQVRQDITK